MAQKGWVIQPFRFRSNGVADSDINLERDPSGAEAGGQGDSDASIGIVLADFGCGYGADVERETVVGTGYGSDGAENVLDFGQVAKIGTEQVKISRGAMRTAFPQEEEHGAFEEKGLPVTGYRDAVKEALDRVADFDEVVIRPCGASVVEKPLTDRSGDIRAGSARS